jgi:hypothetical protein
MRTIACAIVALAGAVMAGAGGPQRNHLTILGYGVLLFGLVLFIRYLPRRDSNA